MATNIAYYLKYRPKSLDELVGQEMVKKTLLLSFQNNKLSHAYLFVGPRGTGKTSTARILAKMVNCEESSVVSRQSSEPCGKCLACISITDGSNMDLIEIDAASNRGIEDIRALRDKIKLSPTSAKKKVYIIDEVHMLTTEAFNALLKTLEEPPSHALFILATTEIGKVPQTILSRVQRLDFKLAKTIGLLEVLQKIVKAEKIDIDEQALKMLVKKADGSFRDGVKLLDQVSSITGKITVKALEETLKSSQFDELLLLVKSFSEKNSTEGLLNISKQLEQGVDVKELMVSLMAILRDMVFIKHGLGEQIVKPQFTEDKFEELVAIADKFPEQELIRTLDILQKNFEKLKFSSIPSLPLELAIIEICEEQSNAIKSERRLSPNEASPRRAEGERTRGDEPQGAVPLRWDVVSEQESGIADRSIHSDELAGSAEIEVVSDSGDILKLKEKWTFVLETIRPYNFSLEALLRAIRITDCTETKVYMEVPYTFHQRILEAPKNRDLLESILSDILGRNIQIATVLGVRSQRKEDVANIEVAQDDEIIRVAAEIFNSDTVN